MRRAVARAGAVVCTAVGALVLVVGGTSAPAFAHAELIETEPAAGARLDTPPAQIILSYSETVDPPGDALEVFDSDGEQVETTDPTHPGGVGEKVAVDLPDLEDGAYVVTWKVTSEDSHPIRGAYTFRIGEVAAGDEAAADDLMDELVAAEGGDRVVGVLFGLDRFAGFVGMILLVGGAIFLLVLWPLGLTDHRANLLLDGAWITALVATVLGFGFQAAYREGGGLGGIVDGAAIADVVETRPGRVWLLRILILAVIAVCGAMAARRLRENGGRLRNPRAALAVTAGLGLALLATISFAGHAAAGDWVPVAIVTDLVHLGAISVWLGGLTTLFVVVLRRVDADTPPASSVGAASAVIEVDDATTVDAVDQMAAVVTRFSRWALVAVVLVVISGTVQAWRQLGSFEALVDTTYGRVLIVKVVLVALVLSAAFVSREWVYRRRAWLQAEAADGEGPKPNRPLSVRTLRRSVTAEVLVAVLVLAVTALLVNTVPGKDSTSPIFEQELHGDALLLDVVVDPAKTGPADIEITTLTHASEPFQPVDLDATLQLEERDVPPIPLQLESTSPGVYTAQDTEIPFAGTWTLTVKVRTGETTQEEFPFEVPVK